MRLLGSAAVLVLLAWGTAQGRLGPWPAGVGHRVPAVTTNRTYVLARPTGVGRADAINIRIPIEGPAAAVNRTA
jgi:hypothetical protein